MLILQLLLILIIVLLILVSSLVYGLEFYVITDKSEYFKNEVIVISGEVTEIIEEYAISYRIISPSEKIMEIGQFEVNPDKTFSIQFTIGGELVKDFGTYVIKLQYGNDKNNSAETTFELLPNNIEIQSDKPEYYVDNIISINGTMTDIDILSDTTIRYDVYYSNETLLETGDGGILYEDGIFNFTINTSDNELWDDKSDYMEVIVTIQNYTASTFFNYYNTPNMANEILYDMIMDANDIIYIQNNMLSTQNDMILSLQENITILTNLVEELIGQIPPLPLDAPIIISVIADDPDDLDDIFSVDDTITILFDSETNIPLGNGMLTKQEINNLFTFSETIAQAYSGMWTNSSAFTISINSIANSKIIINQTTVTPAQTTLILPADNNQENFSHITSPVLDGDWGMP